MNLVRRFLTFSNRSTEHKQKNKIISMNPKIFFRHDINSREVNASENQDESVIIVAPEWTKKGLKELSKYIPKGTRFDVYDTTDINHPTRSIVVGDELTLKDLVTIARNEPINVTGVIQYNYYKPLINEERVVYGLKDLVRQCVIVGRDETTHYGGYPSYANPKVKQIEPIYLADLSGLQFQMSYNTGRLVLVGKDIPEGLLDELIFNEVVGETKKTFKEVSEDTSGRYIKHGSNVYFDTLAYKKFVSLDVYLTGLALNLVANEDVNFKFLKYGTGYFAGNFRNILSRYINEGVAEGLERLLSSERQKWIKQIELPYYQYNELIDKVCTKYNIECKFSQDDALKKTHLDYVTATTNCADPHAGTGNEMGYQSVDSAISLNLKSLGKKYLPLVNNLMREKFVQVEDIDKV